MSLEILDRLSTGQLVETVFESSFGFTYVLFRTVVALYHENDDFGVTVNVISDRCGFACSGGMCMKFARQICIYK